MLSIPQLPLLLALVTGIPADSSPAMQRFHFDHDGVLGTSLDLTFVTRVPAEADAAERVALAEIERLRLVLSGYDDASELSHLMAAGHLVHPSAHLVAVLERYDLWHARSGGAYSARVAPLSALWRSAEAAGHLPDPQALHATADRLASPAWSFDAAHDDLRMLTTDRIDLNSLGKGYVIDQAVAAVRRALPQLAGGIINLGGDIRVWGTASATESTWRVGVADPRAPADNAAPLVVLRLRDRAVSSSGRYARGFTIGGTHYSHIIDPRTGTPANAVAATTVIAGDNATANALATTLSVLSPAEGLALAAATPDVEALIIGADGVEHRTAGFATYEESSRGERAAGSLKATLTIDITPETPNRHRPYVAAWITDTAGKYVRTLAFWADKPKFFPEMSKWFGLVEDMPLLFDAVTRATRVVGEYTLEWDGLNEEGKPVKKGPYLFWLESATEHGAHAVRSVAVTCASPAGTGKFDKTAAFVGGTISCAEAK